MYRFYSNPAENSRVSVVGQFNGNSLQIAVARCSKKDQFIRRKGRLIAEGRLEKGKLYSDIPMNECTSETFVKYASKICQEVSQTKQVYI